ncbi:hypothetical protein AXG93_3786s1220 [Marchantia polymorpha subsp. ruderalis]|uniref:Ubiquitin-like domain-containing protein n=3 Tax=Marchantia polymorpha TaxID=3197 RepID=A0A176W1C7_MARPO|nr:hypothetical protein AXG93_3786s1220 [Marchantia polymorpha subsp. ruderalis]
MSTDPVSRKEEGRTRSHSKEGGELESTSIDRSIDRGTARVEDSRFARLEAGKMIEVVLNDRLGKKVRVKCNEDDTIGDLKKLVAAQTGTRAEKIRIQKWYIIYKDHITLADYEIHDGMGLELYYN